VICNGYINGYCGVEDATKPEKQLASRNLYRLVPRSLPFATSIPQLKHPHYRRELFLGENCLLVQPSKTLLNVARTQDARAKDDRSHGNYGRPFLVLQTKMA
jgi:hypothetical protein